MGDTDMHGSDELSEYVTVGEARDILGVTRVKIAQLIREGVLHAQADPLNGRVKLIRRSEVDELRSRSHFAKKAVPVAA